MAGLLLVRHHLLNILTSLKLASVSLLLSGLAVVPATKFNNLKKISRKD